MAEPLVSDSSSADHSHQHQFRHRSSLSATSSERVADLVRWHLLVRTLVQFKLVSKEWKAWCDENLLELAKQRGKDESRDWYFPFAVGDHHQCSSSGALKWYGTHQWSKEQHTLPDLGFLPYWNDDSSFDYDLEAVSSGLLLLSQRPNYQVGLILIVCNPLSKKWRKLRRQREDLLETGEGCKVRAMNDSPYVEHGAFGRVHTHLVVDDLLNEYKVIRLSTVCVNVYSSSTKRWICSPYDPLTVRMCSPYDSPYNSPLAEFSACFKGRVYILLFVVAAPFSWHYVLRIYDIESGEFVIKSITFKDFNTQDYKDKKVWQRPRDPVLVECMGNLYAVAASCQAGHNEAKRGKGGRILEHTDLSVKVQFHIFKLTEEGRLLEGSWRHVQVPVEIHSSMFDVEYVWESCRHFSCAARSNMICLEWSWMHDNHLGYDVVLGLHRIYTARAQCGDTFYRGYNMAYSPSLDLKP